MLVLEYAMGAVLQILACFGITFFIHKALLSRIESKYSLHLAFAIGVILESTLLGVFFLHGGISLLILKSLMMLKIVFGVVFLVRKSSFIIQKIKSNHWLFIFYSLIFINACVPTSCYDAFTAHFQVPKYFLEYLSYPNRPDFQYLDALPLGIHMLYVLPLSLGLEGGLNVYSLIFTIILFDLFMMHYGKRVGLISILLCLSMPQFIRVAMDPMVDVPNFYFVIFGAVLLNTRKKVKFHYYGLALSWSYLMCIKPTMLIFPVVLIGVVIYDFIKKEIQIQFAFKMAFCMVIVGLFWNYKAYIIHENPFYPYLGEGVVKSLLPKFSTIEISVYEKLLNYLEILFLDHRYFLSFGPWFLICVPLLFSKNLVLKNDFLIYLLVILGFILTFYTTSFKNRYFMPYLILLIPLFAHRLSEAPVIVVRLLKSWVFFVLLTYLPYFLQPVHAGLKNLSKDEYYQRKFQNYSIVNSLNEKEHGKVFYVGSAVYWLNSDHVVSIYSETHFDYSRIKSVEELIKKLKHQQIDTVCIDMGHLEGMSKNTSPYYQKNRYLASKCLTLWCEALKTDKLTVLREEAQVVIAKFQFK